jgi:hypothetical protein
MIPHSTPRYLIAVLCIFALACIARAQMDAGFLGKRYVGASLFAENVRQQNVPNGNGLEFSGNIPLNSFLDAGVKTSFEKFSEDNLRITDQRITGSVVGYADLENYKPFAEVSLTNTAQTSTFSGLKYKNNESFSSFGAGIEAPVSRSSSIFGLITYNRYFNRNLDSYWTYKFGLNTWLTPKLGAVIAVSFWESESTTYSLGLMYRF